jgi:hypothetical protein
MSDPRRFIYLVWTNLKWMIRTAGPIPQRWSVEMRPGEGKKTDYKFHGTVLDVSGTLYNVTIYPVNQRGAPTWTCSCGEGPVPCRHAALVAKEWIEHLKSLPKRRKLVEWLEAEERNLPND